jgi:hypothetical protein
VEEVQRQFEHIADRDSDATVNYYFMDCRTTLVRAWLTQPSLFTNFVFAKSVQANADARWVAETDLL